MTRDAALALWANLRDRMQTGDASLTQVIEELSSHIRAAMALDGVGLLVTSSGRRRAVLGASDDRMRWLEQLQATFGEGPCMDAVHSGAFAGEPNLAHDGGRWPDFAPSARATGIAAAFSFPVSIGEITLGALDCYRAQEGGLTPDQMADGELFADVAADLIMHAQAGSGAAEVAAQLATGDGAPALLEQATGITAVQLGVKVPAAFALIRRHARDHERALDDVAAAIIAGDLRIER